MSQVKTDMGRHVPIEIRIGTKETSREVWRCLKCGQNIKDGWKEGPQLSGCPDGDKLFDRSILNRDPVSEGPRLILPNVDIRFPAFIVTFRYDKKPCPVVLKRPVPGIILIENRQEIDELFRSLKRMGWVEPPKNVPMGFVAINDYTELMQAPDWLLAWGFDEKPKGAYWRINARPNGLHYQFVGFGENHGVS